MKIRKVVISDLLEIRELNENAVPHVNSIPVSDFEYFMEISSYFMVAESTEGSVAGFLIVIPPGKKYESLNYQYFTSHYPDFEYVDRIVIAEQFRAQGIGAALYKYLYDQTDRQRITCEVNVKPPNPQSIAFHEKMGFNEVARQDTEGGKKRVSLMVKEITT